MKDSGQFFMHILKLISNQSLYEFKILALGEDKLLVVNP